MRGRFGLYKLLTPDECKLMDAITECKIWTKKVLSVRVKYIMLPVYMIFRKNISCTIFLSSTPANLLNFIKST